MIFTGRIAITWTCSDTQEANLAARIMCSQQGLKIATYEAVAAAAAVAAVSAASAAA